MAKFLVRHELGVVARFSRVRDAPARFSPADKKPTFLSPARNESPERGGDGNLFDGAHTSASRMAETRILLRWRHDRLNTFTRCGLVIN